MLLRKNQLYKQPYDSTCCAKVGQSLSKCGTVSHFIRWSSHFSLPLSHFKIRFRIYECNICIHTSSSN